jgi:hypothetical protein
VRLCADIPDPPKLPEGASIVQPVTDEERDATALTLSFVRELRGWGDQLAERARIAKQGC